jgi:hypothetical protein
MHPKEILLQGPHYDSSSRVVIDSDGFLYHHDYERYSYGYLSKIWYHQVVISSLLVRFFLPITCDHDQVQNLQSRSDASVFHQTDPYIYE